MFEIRPLKIEDAGIYSKNAPEIYLEFFKYLWHDEGESYAAKSFDPQTFESEIESGEKLFYGVFSGGKMNGFLKLCPDGTLPLFGAKNAFEIEKIYLSKDFHGKGIGKNLMNLSFEIARKLDKEIVWLDVVAGNESAIGFYESLGFTKCGNSKINFPTVKSEFGELIVMKKMLGAK